MDGGAWVTQDAALDRENTMRYPRYVIGVALVVLWSLLGCGSTDQGHSGVQFSRVSSGAFVTHSSSSPSASWIDFDGDGDDDLYVLNGFGSLEDPPRPQKNELYRNDGNGTFTPLPEHPLVQDVTFSGCSTWGDYDNDGDPDVFVANQQDADNFLFRNDGNGSFTRVKEGSLVNDGGRSFSAIWVDIDNDGWIDLHVLNGRDGIGGQKDCVYRNLGNGSFAKVENIAVVEDTLASGGAMWADYDSDGDPDVIVPINSNATTNKVYRNDGNWRFTNVTEALDLKDDPLPYSPRASAVHWVDYDNDLDLDLYVGNVGTIDYLFNNDGTGRFTRVTAGRLGLDVTYVSDAIWADFDNDADLDLLIAVWGGASEYYENNGKGEFHQAQAGDFGNAFNFASSASADDADGDGDLDVYLTQWPVNKAGGEPNQFYLNQGRNGNWLKINLKGIRSNLSAIGAKIIVTATIHGTEVQQLRLVSARTSWRSASSLTQHFGLGDAEKVEQIEVQWPSGAVDKVTQRINSNQIILIEEGKGISI